MFMYLYVHLYMNKYFKKVSIFIPYRDCERIRVIVIVENKVWAY
jgi:hypothetical protein